MRQIILDTETTGLDVKSGHRIIEIGCIEVINRKVSGQNFHTYLNPDRKVDEGAFEVHGLSNDFLSNQPFFSDIVSEFLEFVKNTELVMHNASFDLSFINVEMSRLNILPNGIQEICTILDTLKLARDLHPGQRNSLDALCKSYSIDSSRRELHGALLDAEILAEVYLAMTGGQDDLKLDDLINEDFKDNNISPIVRPKNTILKLKKADSAESDEHKRSLNEINEISGGNLIWPKDL